MDLTIIIVNYNSYSFLSSCINSIRQSLKRSKLKYEIIIIDNASSNISEKAKIKKIIGIRYLLNKKNVGFGAACNYGIDRAKGEFILLLNPDILVLDQAIERLFIFIKNKSNCFVGGKLLNNDYSIQPSCGLFFRLPVVFAMLFFQGERLGLTKFTPKKSQLVEWVSAACLMGRKKDFLSVGKFDEKIFLYSEEVDFLFRAKICGFSCYFCCEAEFVHFGSAVSGRQNAVVNTFRGLLYFYKKHYSLFDLFILKWILRLKAAVAILIGIVFCKKELIRQYKTAFRIIDNYENWY